MQLANGQLSLSPSDVTAFLACEHVTTLQLRVAARRAGRTRDRERAGGARLPQGARARGGLPQPAPGRGQDRRRDLARARPRLGARPRGDRSRRCAAASTSSTRASFVADGWRGRRRLPRARRDAVRLGMELRGGRHQARAPREAGLHPPALLLRRAARPDPGAGAGADPRAARNGRAASFRPQEFGAYYRRVRARLERVRRRGRARHDAVSRATTAGSATSSRSATRGGTRSTTSAASRAFSGGRWRSSRRPGSRRSRRSARRAPSPRRRGSRPETFAKLREQAALQLWARENGRDRVRPARAAAGRPGSRCCPTVAAATSSSTSRATRSGTSTGASSTCGGSSTPSDDFTPLWAHDHETERRAFEQFVDLVHERLADHPDLHVYHYAAYEVTALRRLMGRYGTREAELDDLLRRERLRRPLQGRPQRPARLAAGLRAEGDGGVPRLPARGGDQGRRHLDRRVRASGCRRATRRSSTQIAAYNEEDCVATLLLRDWLLERRAEALEPVRAVPAPRADRAEADAGREGRARGAPRGAARRRRGARRAAARLPRPRAQARLVGVLRPARA